MSTKFNRNNAEAGNDKFYHDDYKADLGGVEQDHFEDIQDFEELPCIVSGLDLTPEVYPSTIVQVSDGTARDADGNRIVIPTALEVELINTAGGNNYVILKHKSSTDTPRNAYSSGVSYDTRIFDDFDLEVAETYEAGDIVLGNVKVVGGVNLLYLAERTHPVYRPDAGDLTAPTNPANLVLTSGIMGDTAVPIYDDNYVARAERLAWLKAAWDASLDYGSGLAGYEVFLIPLSKADVEQLDKREDRTVRYSASDPRTDVTFQNLTPGVKYRVKVRAVDKAGNLSAFASADAIAGGAKQIPDICADLLDDDPTITADDDGIRISWAIKSTYADKVCGVEICYTDDGTTPDFTNKNHRRVFTSRNVCVLPAKMSSDDVTVTVKAKMRGIDITGQHCTTPKTLTDTPAKKYPADLAAIVTDYKSIIDPGDFPTLKTFLHQTIEIASGRSKVWDEVSDELADAREGFDRVGERIRNIEVGAVNWGNVRIVTKSGSPYQTIQAAIDSIPQYTSGVPERWLILVMGGVYTEHVNCQNKLQIMFVFFGATLIGSIDSGGIGHSYAPLILFDGLRIINATSGKHCISTVGGITDEGGRYPIFNNCSLINKSTTGGDFAYKQLGGERLVIRNSYLRAAGANQAADLGTSTGKIKLLNSSFVAASPSTTTSAVVMMQAGGETVWVRNSSFNAANAAPCIRQASGICRMQAVNYTTAPAGAATFDYGALGSGNCVLFDPDDLIEFDEWAE